MQIIFNQNECILYTPDKSIFCDVLQDTPFPIGNYKVRITYSSKHERTLPQILDVPGFKSVRIFTGMPTYNTITVGRKTSTGKFVQQNATMMMLQDFIFGKIKSGEDVWVRIM